MKKWSKKKKITILLLFLVLLALFAGLCWKKRRGIYNTYMKLTNQEIPYYSIHLVIIVYSYLFFCYTPFKKQFWRIRNATLSCYTY